MNDILSHGWGRFKYLSAWVSCKIEIGDGNGNILYQHKLGLSCAKLRPVKLVTHWLLVS